MTPLEDALVHVVKILEGRSIPYMVVGGLANAVWGHPRTTLDVDITLWASEEQVLDVVAALLPEFHVLVSDPEGFVKQTRVLPAESRKKVRVDLIWGMLPFEEQAIRRARARTVAGHSVRFVTAEDLILHKIISDRPRDQNDVEGIIEAQRDVLDRRYLDDRIRALAQDLENPDLWRRYERLLRTDSG